MASGEIAIWSRVAMIFWRISGFVIESAKSVFTKPGDIQVTRSFARLLAQSLRYGAYGVLGSGVNRHGGRDR
jgi:hypothetical protein